jgi:opacity protein-like surface antigen
MNKKLVFAAILITISMSLMAQQPEGTVQFYVGYSLPTHDLQGDFGETFGTWTANPDSNTYFMKYGINYGIYVKFPVKMKSPLQITGGIGFDSFKNTAIYNEDTTGTADITLSQSHLVFAFGGEYNFTKGKRKFNPFIGAEAILTLIGGNLELIYPTETIEYTMKSALRLGFQFGAGFDYTFHHNLGFTLGGKYAIANVFGKDFNEDLGSKYNLGDAEHIDFRGVSVPAKTISYFHFYGGLSFYFGR